MTDERQLLTETLSKTKRNWCVAMVLIATWSWYVHPLEEILLLIPLGVVSYFGSVVGAIAIVAARIRAESKEAKETFALQQIQEEVRNGTLKAGSEEMFERMLAAGVAEISDVGTVSDEILGKMNGEPIHAWIEMVNPATNKLTRFEYHGPGDYEEGGTPIIPDENGKVFAHFNGLVYSARV